jgi:hypothetical protein
MVEIRLLNKINLIFNHLKKILQRKLKINLEEEVKNFQISLDHRMLL